MRLTEAVCELADNSRLRQVRNYLATECNAITVHPLVYRIGELNTVQLFKFLSGVLVSFTGDGRTHSIGSATQ